VTTENFRARLGLIVSRIGLAENFSVRIGRDSEVVMGRFYFQITCYRKDVITDEWGTGHGGKAYLSEHATDSELVGTVFALYKSYVEHEARETFTWQGRRVYGPHMDVDALWEVARRVDIRSAQHVEDRS
jgi:hypothetical protein